MLQLINPCKEKSYNFSGKGFLDEKKFKNSEGIGESQVQDMTVMYDSSLKMRNYNENTRKKLLQIIRKFLATTKIPITKVDTTTVEKYLVKLQKDGKSGKTIENHRSALKGFFDFMVMYGEVKNNPVMAIKRRHMPQELPVYLPDDEIELLIKLAEQEKIVNEITIALNTGLRMNELRNLQWRDVDINHKQLTVKGRYSKNKRARTVPLNQKAIDAFSDQKQKYGKFTYVFPGGKGGVHGRNIWTENTLRSYKWWLRLSLDRIREKIPTIASLPKGRTCRGWHIMRHTFATKLARVGVDLFKIKDWMGHKKVETTIQYVHLARKYDPDIELI